MNTPLKHVLFLTTLLVLAVSTAQAAIDPTKVQKLLAGDGAADDEFGWSVAVSGDTAVIAAGGDESCNRDRRREHGPICKLLLLKKR